MPLDYMAGRNLNSVGHRRDPSDGETVLLRLRGRSKCTDGKVSFWSEWRERVVPAIWCATPYPSESSHFHGNFCVADDDVQYHEVELIEWVGFSGMGKAA